MKNLNYLFVNEILANLKNSEGSFDPSAMGDVVTMEQTIIKTKKPSEWKVVIYNDDVSPIELVLVVLVTVFSKSEQDAVKIMQTAEEKGVATIGVYYYDIAKTLIKNAKHVISDFEATFGIATPLKIEMEQLEEE
jgi:ATP-dependent Clp protease adaptor protein ClpS